MIFRSGIVKHLNVLTGTVRKKNSKTKQETIIRIGRNKKNACGKIKVKQVLKVQINKEK